MGGTAPSTTATPKKNVEAGYYTINKNNKVESVATSSKKATLKADFAKLSPEEL